MSKYVKCPKCDAVVRSRTFQFGTLVRPVWHKRLEKTVKNGRIYERKETCPGQFHQVSATDTRDTREELLGRKDD